MYNTGQKQNPNPLMNLCLPFGHVYTILNMLNWPKCMTEQDLDIGAQPVCGLLRADQWQLEG